MHILYIEFSYTYKYTNILYTYIILYCMYVGAAFGWKATAIGKNYINAKNFLERRYHDDIELDDAVHIALLTLRESFEGEMNEYNIEVGIISKEDKVFRILTPAEVRDYLDEAN